MKKFTKFTVTYSTTDAGESVMTIEMDKSSGASSFGSSRLCFRWRMTCTKRTTVGAEANS